MTLLFPARVLVLAFPALISAQVAGLQIKVVEGDGSAHSAGARAARPLTVEIMDETGRPVAGAAVSFHLPQEGASGIFFNGLRTDLAMTDASGRATIRGFQLNRVPGAFQIRITASKDQARAGTVSNQRISGTVNALLSVSEIPRKEPETSRMQPVVQQTVVRPTLVAHHHSGKKWLVVAMVAAGAATGVVVAHSRLSSSPASSTPPIPTPPALTVGVPVITIVHP
jgi:hypothetical protein